MPVKIRLRRLGAKKKPSYRVVAVDSRVSTRGKVLELLGHYAPIENPAKVDIDIEKVDMWIKKGAQLSDTVRSILRKAEKSQEQEKVQINKDAEAQKEKQKGVGKKVTRKATSSIKVAKSSKGKQTSKKSKKKLSRER